MIGLQFDRDQENLIVLQNGNTSAMLSSKNVTSIFRVIAHHECKLVYVSTLSDFDLSII